MEKYGVTPAEFAEKIDVPRSSLSHLTSGRNKPSLDFVIKIKQSYPDINIEWLLFGEGEMLKSEKAEEKNYQSDLFSGISENDKKNEQPIKKETNSPPSLPDVVKEQNELTRIVLFYKNGKFEEYTK